MLITHILIGIVFGYIIWKLLKVTFKSVLWFLIIGLIVALIFPKALFLVGGIGFLVLSTLVVLLILSVLGFFFFEND
ncbi:hypothetical protein [Ectobacillus panaciterrae]|uniref:hypothetical protein n=1 Tax=Ectobacillus panaciterrae TaxID=363872 RepID=UPI00040F1DCA|nr:hypothetical protein [Ectobacillus panaciterrae]